MEIEVFVTLADTKRGTRCHCDLCPVALAINRALAANDIVEYLATVGGNRIIRLRRIQCRTSKSKHVVFIDAPTVVKTVVYQYDKGRNMRPFNFKLTI